MVTLSTVWRQENQGSLVVFGGHQKVTSKCIFQSMHSLHVYYISYIMIASFRVFNLYSFRLFSIRVMSSANNQTEIVLIKKFSQWNYITSSIRYRMPYLSTDSNNALLTTAKNPNEDFFGTIISRNRTYIPAPWIEGVAENPLHIWYWLREAKGKNSNCKVMRKVVCSPSD